MDEQPKIDWIDMGDGWKRASWVRPGYDCFTECKHTPKGDHGISDDDWIYAVCDGELALAICVDSHVYPPTVRRQPEDDRAPTGQDFEVHCPWPVAGFETLTDIIRHKWGGTDCSLIPAGKCWVHRTSITYGEEWFAEHGAPTFEQPESFWAAFIEKAKVVFSCERKGHEENKHIERCPACDRVGVVVGGKGVLRVVTEVTGRHYHDIESDFIAGVSKAVLDDHIVTLRRCLPDECVSGKIGDGAIYRYRIIVEAEKLEGNP